MFSNSPRMSLHTSQHAGHLRCVLQPGMGRLSGDVTFSLWSPPTQQRPCKLGYGKLPQNHTHHLPSNLDTLFIISCESPDIFSHLCSLWLEVRKYLHKGKGHTLLKGDQTGGMEIRMTRNESLPRLLESRSHPVFECICMLWCSLGGRATAEGQTQSRNYGLDIATLSSKWDRNIPGSWKQTRILPLQNLWKCQYLWGVFLIKILLRTKHFFSSWKSQTFFPIAAFYYFYWD